jgi:Anti-sigma-K factor rskA/Putative zinc-finger
MAEHQIPHPDLGGYVLGALTPEEMQEFTRHLATCPACQAEVAELSGLPAVLGSAVPQTEEQTEEEPPDHLRQRTLAAVEKAARSESARRQPATTVDRWHALRRRPVAVAAGLVLLAVLGAIVLAGRGEDQTGPVTVPLAAVSGQTGSGEATIRQSQEGLAIRLSLDGLKPNRSGTHYECWYVGTEDSAQQPQRVSGGTFTVGPDGSAEVTLTTAADYRKYPGIAVTYETDDGDPGTTGPVVLVSKPG